jgi:uncharacterized protein YcfL
MKLDQMIFGGLLLLATIGLGGCNTVNSTERSNPATQRKMVSDRRIVSDLYLDDHARVVGLSQANTPDGFIKVQVELFNPSSVSCNFRYTFEWFDEQGMLMSTATPSWFPRRILGGESMFITGFAPTTTAKDFQFKMVKE